jgi:hypothetical protein
VVVSKSNFLVALAPYFFPFYAVLLVTVFEVGHLIWGWSRYAPWYHLTLGAAYAFHLTLTWYVLQSRQSDVTGQGYFFSGVVIWLGNISVLLFSVPLLIGGVKFWTVLGWWVHNTLDVLYLLARLGP